MQMSHFRKILIKLSLKYIPCSLKRCIIYVCILNGYKDIPIWPLKGPFRTTAIKYIDIKLKLGHSFQIEIATVLRPWLANSFYM